jgi:glucosylglycerate synthase
VELNAIAPPEQESIDQIGNADLVIGILDGGILDGDGGKEAGSAVAITRDALKELSQPLRAIVLCNNGTHGRAATASEDAGGGHLPAIASCSLPVPGPEETPQQTISNAYRKIFAVGSKLGVRACGLIASRPQAGTGRWIQHLVQPVVDLGFDLVAPCYARNKMEGLLNRSILSPLHRALYGQQLQNPMGPDFGLSGKLLQQVLGQDSVRRRSQQNALALIASAAACGNFQVCESQLGMRVQRSTDWENLSSLLADILGAAFLEMEERAAHWQSIRGSKTLPRFGQPESSPLDAGPLDVHGMIESFQLGTQNLPDVWGLILPPTSLLELKRLARLPQDQFRLPDPIWVRIVYDFALGHRLRTISRDHLLRSMTPLYLGWIASYALEMQSAGLAQVDSRFENLSRAYEDNKSYLVSRWRWPDRFNP